MVQRGFAFRNPSPPSLSDCHPGPATLGPDNVRRKDKMIPRSEGRVKTRPDTTLKLRKRSLRKILKKQQPCTGCWRANQFLQLLLLRRAREGRRGTLKKIFWSTFIHQVDIFTFSSSNYVQKQHLLFCSAKQRRRRRRTVSEGELKTVWAVFWAAPSSIYHRVALCSTNQYLIAAPTST